jgi:hypothetical protein
VAAALIAAATGAPAVAGPVCFARDYDAGHLARNPAQVVRNMRILLPDDPRRDGLRLSVTLADQGHVVADGMAGRSLGQGLFCLDGPGPLTCGVECDGGLLVVTRRDAGILEFRTDRLTVGDAEDCGGSVDLAERPGQPVTYRLFAAPMAACEGL